MFDTEFIDRLASAVAMKIMPAALPLEHQLWDLGAVASYVGRNKHYVRTKVTCDPSFPKAIRFPSDGKAHPMYNAAEVVQWANGRKERN